eukprot:TRINITY_DN8635_c0_g1_i1.p1 TRINITY_DN8635_c0_g1~~TRINITY_DN8635_c0_g1_i1.p1  ORF type:complete len:219 (+),score=63.37 TRINITY_DN8635_c0_g1_i1:108-764(+)
MAQEYQVAVIGAIGAGKSATTIQFYQQAFIADYDPVLEDSYRRQMHVDSEVAYLDVWDTAGPHVFTVASLKEPYLTTCEGFLVVYSVTDKDSFVDVEQQRNRVLAARQTLRCPCVLFGNKADLASGQRQVPTEEAQRLAKTFFRHPDLALEQRAVPFLEGSAKTSENVEEAFVELVREIRRYRTERAQALQALAPHMMLDSTGGGEKKPKKKRRCVIL